MPVLMIVLAVCFLASTAFAQVPSRPSKIVIFGDSLSDTGNAFIATDGREPPSPPYFSGRFSNGRVWVELFAEAFGHEAQPALNGGDNYAVGGAKTAAGADSLEDQASTYIVTHAAPAINKISSGDLFIVFGGGNDMDDAIKVSDPAAVMVRAALNIGDVISKLHDRGAANFLVPNLPNKGATPAARGRGDPELEQALSVVFNNALVNVIDDARKRLNVNVVSVDFFSLGQTLFAAPESFGFTDVTNPCLVTQGAGFAICPTPETHVFWDSIHPTAKAHALLANAAIAAYESAVTMGTARLSGLTAHGEALLQDMTNQPK